MTEGKSMDKAPRSLHLDEWPEADRRAWEDACRPNARLKAGGTARHLAQVSREDFARRYGAFLGFLQRTDRFKHDAAAAAQVILPNVGAYIAELTSRVSSVTTWNCVYKLRRAAELIAPAEDFSWLAEIEKDLALVMQPRSKFDRIVFTDRLVEAGLTLIAEAQQYPKSELERARGVRNGLMIALLALCPIRLKNFAALEIGKTIKMDQGSWWIILLRISTKTYKPDERRVQELLYPAIDLYLRQSRPILLGSAPDTRAMWISSTTGSPLTKKNLGTLISKITLETVGVDVSPHLFRTAGASTAATYIGDLPHLGSALLNHTDPRDTEEHYRRVSSINAAKAYSALVQQYQRD
jgi:integrase